MTTLNFLPGISHQPLSQDELSRIHAYWRAANYLSVGQIYLYGNPLLRQPLKLEHVKPRLLGHWGTTPGLNFIYAHFNRVIKKYDLNAIYICGPGHGGPGMVANSYLEGTYTELYPSIQQSEDGLHRLFKQFSFPGGIPSHAAPETPGSIHEGGELGYSLSHACGAAFDNPDLLVAWPDSESTQIPSFDVRHSTYRHAPVYHCRHAGGPATSDWCEGYRDHGYKNDDSLLAGWMAKNRIGFAWDAPQD